MSSILSVRHALWFKLTAAFLLVAITGVLAVSILANQVTANSFRTYLHEDQAGRWGDLQSQLVRSHAQLGNWNGAEQILITARPGRGQGGGSLALLDENDDTIITVGKAMGDKAETALRVGVMDENGRLIATILIAEPGGQMSHAADKFLADVNRAIWMGGLFAIAAALFLGLFLARRLTRPLSQLTQAAHSVAEGELGEQVHVSSTGEIGELATSFNSMSLALAEAEQQRQQMLADVAHELRTPISIMRSHLEAMLDGVFETSSSNLALIHEETLLLGRLVEDLRTLSLAEAGSLSLTMETVDMAELIAQAMAAFEPLAEAEGIELTAVIPPHSVMLNTDANRMHQVLGNLLSNALRHVVHGTQLPHAVTVTLLANTHEISLTIADNGLGLSPQAQEHVFDRFWRADSSRTHDQGGSGLGLAISQAIVVALNGRVSLESKPQEGAAFTVTLSVSR